MSGLKIGLLWHSLNSEDLGLGAASVAHMAIAARAAERAGRRPVFTIFSAGFSAGAREADPQPAYFEAANASTMNVGLADFARPRGGFVDQLKTHDVVLDIGAGRGLSDVYGAGHTLRMVAAHNLVRLAGVPLVAGPQTIGPFDNPLIERMALGVLGRAQLVVARDALSARFAADMGLEHDVVEACDLAMGQPIEPAAAGAGAAPIRVGVDVAARLSGDDADGVIAFEHDESYRNLLTSIVDALADRPGVEAHLIGAPEAAPGAVDRQALIANGLAEGRANVVVAPRFASPSEQAAYLQRFDFFVGARFQPCLAAIACRVATVALSHGEAHGRLFNALGYDALVDCRRRAGAGVVERVVGAFENRAVLTRAAERARDVGLSRLKAYEGALARVFADVKPMKASA